MEKTSDKFYFSSSDEAEAAFYSAFEMADLALMQALHADDNVSCIHPNSMPLIGRESVLTSWENIFENLQEPAFYPEVLSRSIEGDKVGNIAIHVVAEHVAADHEVDSETCIVIATNVYIKQENGWRMMMHHSSLPSFTEKSSTDTESESPISHDTTKTMH